MDPVRELDGAAIEAEALRRLRARSKGNTLPVPRGSLVETDDAPVEDVPEWPAPLSAVATPTLVGEVLDLLEPHTEADRAALLAHLLVGFGSCINRAPYFAVGKTWHHTNLFALCVGPTAKGRKGTAWGEIRGIFRDIDDEWAVHRCVGGGLVSGEGLIYHCRDPLIEKKEGKDVVTDAGVTDKRLCIVDSEYSATLRVMTRDSNTLSPVLRTAWETGDLATLAKNSPTRATAAHISIMGHVSKEELLKLTTQTDVSNGYLNRHLLFMVKRSKELPMGGTMDRDAVQDITDKLRYSVTHARSVTQMSFDREAEAQWKAGYHALSAEGPGGLLGAVLGRAEPQVLRLALIYALLEQQRTIQCRHLNAALEVWRFCAESGRFIFGDRLGDPLADRIYGLLLDAGAAGMGRTDIYNAFGKNKLAADIKAVLLRLNEQGRARQVTAHDTGGAPKQTWYAVRLGVTPSNTYIRRGGSAPPGAGDAWEGPAV